MLRNTIAPEKIKLREKLEHDTKEFLAKGGKIKFESFGCYSEQNKTIHDYQITTEEKRWKNGKQ